VGLALITALATIGVAEAWARARGAKPWDDSAHQWWQRYDRLLAGSPSAAVVLCGDSRVEMGLDPTALAEVLSAPVENFGRERGSPVVFLEHTLDALRVGPRLLIVGYSPASFWGDNCIPATEGWHDNPPRLGERLEAALDSVVAGRLAVRRGFHLWTALEEAERSGFRAWYARRPHGQFGFHVEAEPEARRAATQATAENMRSWLLGQGTIPVETTLARWERVVSRAQALGARVLVVRMPATGPVRATEETSYPDAALLPQVGRTGATILDPQGHPDFPRLTPPEGSHLSQDQAQAFSRALGQWIQRQPWWE
jgi:hypothetical protein